MKKVMIFDYLYSIKQSWNIIVIYCEKYTVDDFLQRYLDFTPRSAVVHGDLFAVVTPWAWQ